MKKNEILNNAISSLKICKESLNTYGKHTIIFSKVDQSIKELETINSNEYILCAAIHYKDSIIRVHQPKNIGIGLVICGRRHHNCLNVLNEIDGEYDRHSVEHGFLTNTDRFVGQLEAEEIARKVGQVDKLIGSVITSEDLY